MDTLALLCNLHADGPASLAKLRAAGCATLADLDQLPLRTLCTCLGEDTERARRFLREGGLLAGRVGPVAATAAATDASESRTPRSSAPIHPVRSSPATQRSARPAAGEDSASSGHFAFEAAAGPFAAMPAQASAPDAAMVPAEVSSSARREQFALQPIKDAVLRVWSEQDRLDPPHAWKGPTADSGVPPACAPESELRALDGLDAAACAALAAAGIHGAADLLGADLVALASRTKLAYSKLNRWNFLLRRKLADPGERSGRG